MTDSKTLWQELNEGTATIIGFATLCSMSMCGTAEHAGMLLQRRYSISESEIRL